MQLIPNRGLARTLTVPRVGRVVASMHPFDNVGTARLSTSVHDRLNRIVVGYQDAAAEEEITALRSGLTGELGERIVGDAVAVTRGTRTHPDIRQGSSVRGAIDTAMIAWQLAALRGLTEADDEAYPELFYDAMTVGLSARIHVDEAVGTTPERVLRELWEDRFILEPHTAEPG